MRTITATRCQRCTCLIASVIAVVALVGCGTQTQEISQEAVSMPRGQSGSFLVDGDYSEGTFFGTDLTAEEMPEIQPISLNYDDDEFIAFMEEITGILGAGPVDFCRVHHTVTTWLQAPVHSVFPDTSEKALAYVNSLIAVSANLSEVTGTAEQREELKSQAEAMIELRDVKVLRILFGVGEPRATDGDSATPDDDDDAPSAPSSDASDDGADTPESPVDGPLTDEQRAEQLAEVTRIEGLLADVEASIVLIQQIVNDADYRAHRDC